MKRDAQSECIKVAVNEAADTVFASANRKTTRPMKPHLFPTLVAAVLLLVATQSGWALPPRQHSVASIIEVSNCANRTLTLKASDTGMPLTFVWNDRTRFLKPDGSVACCCLDSGQIIRLWYRHEAGKNILREVSVKDVSARDAATVK